MIKESKTFSRLPTGEFKCQIRVSDDNWQLHTRGVGEDRTEAFRNALIELLLLTTLNVKKYWHK